MCYPAPKAGHLLLNRIICVASKIGWARHLKETWTWIHNHQHFLHFSTVQSNTQQSPRIVIYSGKGVVFLTAVKVRDIVSREAGPVFTEQKEFTTHPHSLPLSLLCLSMSRSLSLSSVCGPRGSLQLERLVGLESMRGWSVWRRLLWSEVHHWHDPSASLRPGSPLQPWQRPLPAATHTELSVEECIRPEDDEYNTIVFLFFFSIHGWGYPQPSLSVLVSLYRSFSLLGSAQYLWCHLAALPVISFNNLGFDF